MSPHRVPSRYVVVPLCLHVCPRTSTRASRYHLFDTLTCTWVGAPFCSALSAEDCADRLNRITARHAGA